MVFKFCLFVILSLFIVFAGTSASIWPDDQDGVNYLLGIDQYDLTSHQPHFPGYPLYVAIGKLFTIFSESPESACVFLSVFSGTICLWLMSVMVQQTNSHQTSLLCTAALAVNPAFFEFSHKIFTEMPALALLISAITLLGNPVIASSFKWFSAALFFGLMLGVRLSWWPFALFYLINGIRRGKGSSAFIGLLLGVFFWLFPQTAVVGARELFTTGTSFVYGHFDQWGGAMGSELEADHRFLLFAIRTGEAFGWIGSGMIFTRLPWIAFTISGIFMVLNKWNCYNAQIKTFCGAGLFYMLWAISGQNPEKVRHLLPLVPVFVLALSPFIEKHKKMATATILIFSFSLLSDYSFRTQNNPPAVQFLNWSNSSPIVDAEFYCGDSERFFDRYPSKQRIKNVDQIGNLQFVVKSSWPKPVKSFVCDDIPGFIPTGKPIKIFHARRGDPVDRTLRFYNLADELNALWTNFKTERR